MPNPKRRHSKARRDKRRTHQKLSLPQTDACPHCGSAKLSHRVCMVCGYYNGAKVLDVEKRQLKKEKKKEKK